MTVKLSTLGPKIKQLYEANPNTNAFTDAEKTKLANLNPEGNTVTSVFGRIGAVVAMSGDYNAAMITFTPAGGLASNNVQGALEELEAEKQAFITPGLPNQYYRGDKVMAALDKAAVGLENVDNTSDANKPVSTAQQTALNAKYNASNPAGYVNAATAAAAAPVQSVNGEAGDVILSAADVGAPSGSGTSTGTNTGDQTITLTGEATGSGTGSFAVTLTNSAVIGKVLTGFAAGAGVVAATDTILQAINKLVGNIAALVTGVSSVFGRAGAVVATAGDYTATQITNTPAGGIAATTVQAALNELDTEKSRGMATFNMIAPQLGPVDNASYFFAGFTANTSPTSSGNGGLFYAPFAGVIKWADVYTNSNGAAGTSENISFYIRVNNTTDYLIGTVGLASGIRRYTNHAMNVTLAENDYFEVKMLCPTWATNPSNVRIMGTITMERT